ncbi:MAG: response regulator [Bryobacteraceae bacterium]|nr:response regulator [Bryobacteraceae bacterium]
MQTQRHTLASASELRHSLRTPLNHIIGNGEMMLEELEGPAAAEGTGKARESLVKLIGNAREMVKFTEQALSTESGLLHAAALRELKLSLVPGARQLLSGVDDLVYGAPKQLESGIANLRFAAEQLLALAQDSESSHSRSNPGADSARSEARALGPRLLLVDDSAGNRDILRRYLEQQGYDVTVSDDGQKCLQLLDEGDFALVLLDVVLPVLDGFQVLTQIKANPALCSTPVILISALDESSSAVRCIQMGADDYLVKPFDPVLLSARIEASIEKTRLRVEEKRRADELEQALNQLRQTQDRMVVQDKLASLGALTAGIAHEIKNPLNFVTNFATASRELVIEVREQLGTDPRHATTLGLLDQLEQYVAKIDEHGNRANRIVRGMLMHSRGKSGEREPVDLNSLLTDCVSLAFHGLRAQDRAFNVRIVSDLKPDVGIISAVPQDLSRVFLNIVNNACYAAYERRKKEGEDFDPVVSIRSQSAGPNVEVRICDNGPGIPEELLPKIFNPFFTTKPAGAGTGLGLSISNDIVVRGHGGTIRAESSNNNTEFVVVIPRESL